MAWLSGVFNKSVLINLAITGIFFALFYLENIRFGVALHDVQYFNGWLLAACITVMLLLTFRKRIVILPFGRVRFWLLFHYYLGLVTFGVFLVHTRARLPDSPLEWLLWVLFMLVAASGLFGGLISATIPPRLEAHGERILFDRIPVFRAQLAAEAETLARESVNDGNTVSIAKLYVESLSRYFGRPRNILAHLRSSSVPRARIMGELVSIERYLDETGKARLAKMYDLVDAKNNLDFHYANGGLLRLWLFLHIPPTYAMLAIIVVHVVLAYAFSTS